MFAFPIWEDLDKLKNNKLVFHIIGLPMSIKSYNKEINTYLMPKAIRDASYKIYSTIFGDIYKAYIIDEGDIDFEEPSLNKLEIIEELRIENKKNIFIFLGGNHLISYYTIKKLKPDLVLHFDAHPDVDKDKLNNASFFRFLIKEQNFELIQIGICNGSKEELEFLKKNKITYFTPLDFYRNKETIIKKLKEKIKKKNKIYITIDVDFLKDNIASYQSEPLGIDIFDFLLFMKELVDYEFVNKLIGFDLVELDPTKDINEFSTLKTTRLLLELIAIFNSAYLPKKDDESSK